MLKIYPWTLRYQSSWLEKGTFSPGSPDIGAESGSNIVYLMLKNTVMIIRVMAFLLCLSASCNRQDGAQMPEPVPSTLPVMGADVSFVPQIRKAGYKVQNPAGKTEDILLILKKAGVNTIRLRLWHTPAGGHSGLAEVVEFAREVHAQGMKVLLAPHYADSWADPEKQVKPAAWSGLPGSVLADSVYEYTRLVTREVKPDYIQIGNEINNGLLWPEGHASDRVAFKSLLQAGIQGARDGHSSSRIVLHYAGHAGAEAFFGGLSALDYDMIGLSYYPLWHGKDLDALTQNIIRLSQVYDKDVFIAETSYPFTLGWNDYTNNIIGLESQLLPAYAATPQGQQAFLESVRDISKKAPRYAGFCYWGAEWVSFKGSTATDGSTWENQAFWGFSGSALPVLRVYGNQ